MKSEKHSFGFCKHFIRFAALALLLSTSHASAEGLFSKLRHRDSSSPSRDIKSEVALTFEDRQIYTHVPRQLPPSGTRALVIVLHGGLGNAERIATARSEKGMNLDDAAEKYGFVVAYMNGTRVSHIFGNDKRGWNAGLCCGLPAENKVDDVGYIAEAVKFLGEKYGIDPRRVYGIGHSNGAMMVQRMICETQVLAAAVSISGTLNIKTDRCPGAQGRSILEIHGEGDTAVPLEGGYGKGVSAKNFKQSQDYARQRIEGSGGHYTLEVYAGAEHQFDTISSAVLKQDAISIQEKITRFFGLGRELP